MSFSKKVHFDFVAFFSLEPETPGKDVAVGSCNGRAANNNIITV